MKLSINKLSKTYRNGVKERKVSLDLKKNLRNGIALFLVAGKMVRIVTDFFRLFLNFFYYEFH